MDDRRHCNRLRDRATLIDALVLTIGAGTLSWVFLISPYAHDHTLAMLTKLTSIAYPVMDLLLLAVGARLVLATAARGRSAQLLGAALLALLATDAIYGWALLHGGYETGGLLDGGWILFYALIGAAALHPSMRRLSEPGRSAAGRLTRRRLALFAAASLVAPATQIVRSTLDLPREPIISIAAGALLLLVLARMAGLVRVHDANTESRLRAQFEGRLAALVNHASDIVAILDADGRLTYLSPSGARLLEGSVDHPIGRRWLEFVHPDDAPAVERFLTELAPRSSGSAEYRVPRPDGTARDVETLATNLLTDQTVAGIVLNTRDVSERKALERRLAHLAFHDSLTGLPGRALLNDRIEHALTRHRRDNNQLPVLFLDLDDFKTINDTLGHAAGDTVLREVAAWLHGCVRACDTAARVGGDEFALLLDPIEGVHEASTVAERVIESLSDPITIEGRQLITAPSIGIALATGDTPATMLLGNADAAMYRAKEHGKGRYAVFGSGAEALGTLTLQANPTTASAQQTVSPALPSHPHSTRP